MLPIAPAPHVVLLWGAGVPRKVPHTPGILGLRKAGVGVSGCSGSGLSSSKTNWKKGTWGEEIGGTCQPGAPLPAPQCLGPPAPVSPKVSQCLLSRFLTGFQKQLLELLLILGAAQFCVGSTWGSPVRQVGRGGARPSGWHGARAPLRLHSGQPPCVPGPREAGWGPRTKCHSSPPLQGPLKERKTERCSRVWVTHGIRAPCHPAPEPPSPCSRPQLPALASGPGGGSGGSARANSGFRPLGSRGPG